MIIKNIYSLIGLLISTILILSLFVFIRKQNQQTKVKKSFLIILFCLLIWCLGLISQITLSEPLHIKPIYFDYFVYVCICFTPVAFLVMSLKFAKPNDSVNIKRMVILSSLVPIVCLIALWTNNSHNLFYEQYSVMLSEGSYGPFFYITTAYTYLLFGIALYFLGTYSIKNMKFYFLQSLLIFIGALVPIIVNLFGVLGLFNLSIYVTPICFSITILCFSLSIFKFGFLKVTPVTLKNIVNRISDCYMVLNEDDIVVDFNTPFLETFKLKQEKLINKNFSDISKFMTNSKNITKKILAASKKTKGNDSTLVIDEYFSKVSKYFHVEINSIWDGKSYLGTLLLFKDVTQHKLDLETIQNNQEILVEKERLASLGQMIGGIAHNLKTPIMSISGAAEGLSDLINEYDSSVGDQEVTIDDHHEIAGDMREWISKIKTHLSYMSDVITAVKGQAVAFADNASFTSFTIDDFVKQVNILMKHELSHALVELEEDIQIPLSTNIKGNINSLVQVINNIISNSIQAYDGKEGQKIILKLYKEKNNLIIKIQDFAGGIPDTVKDKLFKEMATTKGKNGTGLGLFMSYSNIKAHFNGNIRFETIKNEGTSFFVEIPT